MKLEFKDATGGWGSNGCEAYINNIHIGSISYGMNSKGENKPWISKCFLPSLKNPSIRVASIDDGKKILQAQVDNWFKAVADKGEE